jgi:cytosine permease
MSGHRAGEPLAEPLLEDYSRHPVPTDKLVTGWRIGLVVIGVAITVPAFLSGAQIGHALGVRDGLIAILAGGALIAVTAGLTGAVGARTRLPTAMILRGAFGAGGARLVNSLIGLTLLGWFSVTAQLFGDAVGVMTGNLAAGMGKGPIVLGGAAIMTATTIFGFKALDKLSLAAVPLMALFLIAILILAQPARLAGMTGGGTGELGLGQAISAVAGSFMVGATIFPDLARYAKTPGHAMLAAGLGFLVGFPAVLLAAAAASMASGESDFLKVIMALGLGGPGLALIIFATWTTNANNIYSASLFFAPTLPGVAKWKIVIAAGAAGAGLAWIGLADRFIPFLMFLGVAIPPVAGIYIAHFLILRRPPLDSRPVNWLAMAVWAASFALGGGAASGLYDSLTGAPACDTLIIALVAYSGLSLALARTRRKQPA